jgi:pyruvate dehydrogenase E2 component (dihydrolipoamide acetyltransferase)
VSVGSSDRVAVPDIGDFDAVPVIEILVSVGDTVAAEDPLVTLESDKATMDVPAPYDGVVKQILVSVDDTVSEGAELMVIQPAGGGDTAGPAEADGADVADTAGTAAADAPDAADTAGTAEADAPDAADTSGASDVSAETTAAVASATSDASPDTSSPPASDVSAEASTPTSGDNGAGPIYASPSARRLARERQLDISALSGSGRGGRITRDDVQHAADAPAPPAAGSGAVPTTPQPAPTGSSAATVPSGGGGLDLLPWPKVDFEKFGPVDRVARTRIQRISARNLARNWVMIPHVTHNDDADITELEDWRKLLNQQHEREGVKFTMVSFLVKASVAALKQFENVNASLDGDELVLKRYYNIGFAADTPNGLVVPVIKDADAKGIKQIAQDLTELSAKARDGKLSSADITGATFTISSLGGIGGTSFTPIINAPEVAILGATRAQVKPIWNGSEFTPRLMVPLSLSYDHRVIDGAAAARFMVYLAGVLSDLRRALL